MGARQGRWSGGGDRRSGSSRSGGSDSAASSCGPRSSRSRSGCIARARRDGEVLRLRRWRGLLVGVRGCVLRLRSGVVGLRMRCVAVALRQRCVAAVCGPVVYASTAGYRQGCRSNRSATENRAGHRRWVVASSHCATAAACSIDRCMGQRPTRQGRRQAQPHDERQHRRGEHASGKGGERRRRTARVIACQSNLDPNRKFETIRAHSESTVQLYRRGLRISQRRGGWTSQYNTRRDQRSTKARA